MAYQLVSFTSDYGIEDAYVPACVGVIARIAPEVRVVDVTHQVPPQDIRRGSAVLAQTVGYFPPAIHFAVVDPGVGTARRGIAIETSNALLVGPDNGLLPLAAEVLGGIVRVHELTEPRFRLPEVSATFHGRDIFAPAVAHLALGESITNFGPALDPTSLVRLPEPKVIARPGFLDSEVLGIDSFGNLQLAAGLDELHAFGGQLGDRVRLRHGEIELTATLGRTFADVPVGYTVIHPDSVAHLAVAVNGGSVVDLLGGRPDSVTISR